MLYKFRSWLSIFCSTISFHVNVAVSVTPVIHAKIVAASNQICNKWPIMSEGPFEKSASILFRLYKTSYAVFIHPFYVPIRITVQGRSSDSGSSGFTSGCSERAIFRKDFRVSLVSKAGTIKFLDTVILYAHLPVHLVHLHSRPSLLMMKMLDHKHHQHHHDPHAKCTSSCSVFIIMIIIMCYVQCSLFRVQSKMYNAQCSSSSSSSPSSSSSSIPPKPSTWQTIISQVSPLLVPRGSPKTLVSSGEVVKSLWEARRHVTDLRCATYFRSCASWETWTLMVTVSIKDKQPLLCGI